MLEKVSVLPKPIKIEFFARIIPFYIQKGTKRFKNGLSHRQRNELFRRKNQLRLNKENFLSSPYPRFIENIKPSDFNFHSETLRFVRSKKD